MPPDPTPRSRAGTPPDAPAGVAAPGPRDVRRSPAEGAARLTGRCRAGEPIADLVRERAAQVDRVLVEAWQRFLPAAAASELALVAVGGYGRGELHPGSDVDITILLEEGARELHGEAIEAFLTFLWDSGIEVGPSTRTIADCVEQARADITVATNLMEARLLAGSAALFAAMEAATGPDRIWPSRQFFEAKAAEQEARHHRFGDTGYNLEPNVKEGPGGLRDIQNIGWVAKRHFGARTLHDLVAHGFLTEHEYATLAAGQDFLWRVRWELHALTGRREDRLLFDHQRAVALALGARDGPGNQAIEQFMQRYFRTIMELSRLNEMLLQLLRESIVFGNDPGPAEPINRRFQSRRGYLEVVDAEVFQHQPFALMELFLILAQRPDLEGVRATTIRLVRDHARFIDDSFRRDLRVRGLFMELLRQPAGITLALRRMHRYGVLGAYLPSFGRIVGRMQYDLFHVYTVDEHTLFVLRNLRRFTVPEHREEFPLCSAVIGRIPKPELLYIAGIFHDIAKGRGGDHSELGAEDAARFCQEHGLSDFDTRLVAWLVRNHLLMSVTAQREDLSDPEVIVRFARQVGDQMHLDYLYLLTVADIRATNPEIWNSWKDALLRQLYNGARRALRRGLAQPLDLEARLREVQSAARKALAQGGPDPRRVAALWDTMGDEYFLRYAPEEIAWHTRSILAQPPPALPLVLLRPQPGQGSTAIFIYGPARDGQFAAVTATLEQQDLNVVDARITTSRTGHTLDTYQALEQDGSLVADPARLEGIRRALVEALSAPRAPRVPQRRQPRQLRHFDVRTEVGVETDPGGNYTVVEVVTKDRPGILSRVGQALVVSGTRLHKARIATIGHRAEDVFFVTDREDRPLSEPARIERLRQAILEQLGA